MSKLSEYSKFDHLDEDDDEEEAKEKGKGVIDQRQESAERSPMESAATSTASIINSSGPAHSTTQHIKPRTKERDVPRLIVSYQGNRVYEWEQTLDSVTLFVPAPPLVKAASSIICHITHNHLQLGLLNHRDPNTQQQKWYLDEDTYGTVDTQESTWSVEDDDDDDDRPVEKMIVIYLTKAHLAEIWEAALRGNRKLPPNVPTDGLPTATGTVAMDPFTKEEIQRRLVLERFQQEHPGMDFRGATFNGSVPDPRTFMGGMPYK